MTQRIETLSARIGRETDEFRDRLVQIASTALLLTALIVGGLYYAIEPDLRVAIGAGLVVVGTAATLLVFRAGRRQLARTVLCVSLVCAGTSVMVFNIHDALGAAAIQLCGIVVILAGFLSGPRSAAAFGGVSLVQVLLAAGLEFGDTTDVSNLVAGTMVTLALLGITALLVFVVVRQSESNVAVLRERLDGIDDVVTQARRIAKGDLTGNITGDSDVSEVVQEMLDGLRALVGEIRETASRLSSATSEIAAMSRQQEQGAVEQSSAVMETRQTLEAMLAFATQIADSVRGVTANAESTLQNTEQIGEHVESLGGHVRRIGEILEMIKDIANKSELLALNAALEGARAGEAGRGFSLVANQMQRLAESVMESVARIRQLTADIAEATSASASATSTTTSLASETAQVARRIAIITQHQASSAEQVSDAMDDIAQVTEQTTAGATQTQHATAELTGLADRLARAVDAFQLE